MLAIQTMSIVALIGFFAGAWHGWKKERDVVMAMLMATIGSIVFFLLSGFFIGSFYTRAVCGAL